MSAPTFSPCPPCKGCEERDARIAELERRLSEAQKTSDQAGVQAQEAAAVPALPGVVHEADAIREVMERGRRAEARVKELEGIAYERGREAGPPEPAVPVAELEELAADWDRCGNGTLRGCARRLRALIAASAARGGR